MMTRKIRVYNRGQYASSKENHHYAFGHHHSAQQIGDAFVKKYYNVLCHFPENTYKFYKDESILSRPENDGMRSLTTVEEIKKDIMHSDLTKRTIIILSMHAQNTVAQSVIVGVTGLLSKDSMLKCFSQTFLLAPQERGFYVQNDFLQFIDMNCLNASNDTEYYLVSMEDKGIYAEKDIKAVLPHELNNIAPSITQSYSNTHEDVKKLPYASYVAKANSLPSPNANVEVSPKPDMQGPQRNAKDTTTEAVLEVLENDQNHKSSSTEEVIDNENNQVVKISHPNAEEAEKKESYATNVRKVIPVPVPSPASEQVLADKSSTIVPATTQSSDATRIGTPTESSAVNRIAKTILVKHLPPHVTRKSLTHALKDFGPVKHRNIQIRGYPDGYRYAFVEFNNPRAANQAVQAGSINFDGWECHVEHRRVHSDHDL